MSSIGLRKAARIKAIHAACREQGIDDEALRAIQVQITGKASLSEMDYSQVSKVLDHLNRGSGYTGHVGKPKDIEGNPQLQKIEALLADMKLPWAYLHKGADGRPSMCRRLTGKDRIEWADGTGLQAVITALIKRQQKAQG